MINYFKHIFGNKKTIVEGRGKLDVAEAELNLADNRYTQPYVLRSPTSMEAEHKSGRRWRGVLRPSCIPITIILILVLLVILLPLLNQKAFGKSGKEKSASLNTCTNNCIISLVESIPYGLNYSEASPLHMPTFTAWSHLINDAQHSLEIASFYWTLRGEDVVPDPSAWQGEEIFKKLLALKNKSEFHFRIVQNKPSQEPPKDTDELAKNGAAKVRTLDVEKLLGAGILHTKLWIADKRDFYVGSANMDWRALTQVKEMGILIKNCSCLADDMHKIFQVYWMLAKPGAKIPATWPRTLETTINAKTPLTLKLNNSQAQVYIGSSPEKFCPPGRTTDLDAILEVISRAKKYVHVAVMDYFPSTLYTHANEFWPVLDNALRRAAIEKGIRVQLLGSLWNHTRPVMVNFLNSLMALNSSSINIETRLFVVPPYNGSEEIPFTRVNHNKYMVTDESLYIGTSNWAADYFLNTGGIGFVLHGKDHPAREQLASVFDRDWNSPYAHNTL